MASLLRGLAQRLGRLDVEVAALAGRSPLWLHAASVGEVLSAESLVERLRREEPEHPVLATTTSLTGRDTARTRLGVPATLLPLDLPPLIDSVVARLAPAALVIVETEIWPGLIGSAARRGVPVLMVSARMSDRAAARYARVRPLVAGVLGRVTAVAAQTQVDADRFLSLGAPAERVRVVGSLKFARRAPAEVRRCPIDLGDRPVLVAASTQPGEEEIVLDACASVWATHPQTLLVLAPRRPERFDEVGRLLARRALPWDRRSRAAASVAGDTRVLLLDSIGELATFFAGARAAFVGGTLAPLGGHNVLEPATFGVPVAFGPHLDNVREAAELLRESGGGGQVGDAAELGAFWRAALDDPEAARARGSAAAREIERRAAVLDEVVELIRRELRRPG